MPRGTRTDEKKGSKSPCGGRQGNHPSLDRVRKRRRFQKVIRDNGNAASKAAQGRRGCAMQSSRWSNLQKSIPKEGSIGPGDGTHPSRRALLAGRRLPVWGEEERRRRGSWGGGDL
jgi:hypothetical protein